MTHRAIGIRLGSDQDARNAAYAAQCGPGADRWLQQWEQRQRERQAGLWPRIVDTTGELVRETVEPVGRAS
jgi:hypothetical protein